MIDYETQAVALLKTLAKRLGAGYFTADREPTCGVMPTGQLFVTAGELIFSRDEASGEPVATRVLDGGGTQVGWVCPEGCILWDSLPLDGLPVSMS